MNYPTTSLPYPTDGQTLVSIGTFQVIRHFSTIFIEEAVLQESPVHAEISLEPGEILGTKALPSISRVHFLLPARRNRRDERRYSGIFFPVRHISPPSPRPEPTEIFPRVSQVMRIHRKVCDFRRVLPDPKECLLPIINGTDSGPLDVSHGRERLTINVVHSRHQRDKQYEPSPHHRPEHVLS